MSSVAITSSNTDKQQPKTAKEVIAANVQSLIQQLEAGHSDALTAYLNAMSRFHNYSFGNILEIARQKPDATRVAGFWKWKELGRSVKKGEKGTCNGGSIFAGEWTDCGAQSKTTSTGGEAHSVRFPRKRTIDPNGLWR